MNKKLTPAEYLAELDKRDEQRAKRGAARPKQRPSSPKTKRASQKRVTFRPNRRIFPIDNSTCAYCGNSAQTVDHVIPMARAALHTRRVLDDESNKVPACSVCNQEKGDMLPERWFELHPEYIQLFMENSSHLSERTKLSTGLWKGVHQ
jgi:5-methylcytosine-specific restriction endonuclease McrA